MSICPAPPAARRLMISSLLPMPVMPWMMLHHGVTVRPIVAIVAAIGVRVARSEVLTICVGVELRTIAWVFDDGLRQRGSCESCRGKSGGESVPRTARGKKASGDLLG
jgi:hypothetical protein